jgi:hypothetical protein
MEIVIKDSATAALNLLDARLKNRSAVSEAAGLAVVSLSTRSFNDPSVRAAPWAPLQPETIARKLEEGTSTAILKRHGLLFRSYRMIEATNDYVRVGSDRATPGGLWSLAAIHQFGTKDGRIPARPMMPLMGSSPDSAILTPLAVRNVQAAAMAALKKLL